GDHPAVDDRQAGGNAARLDMFAVVAAEAGAASKPQDEPTTTHREMAAFGLESACNVIAVIPQIWISRFSHVRLSRRRASRTASRPATPSRRIRPPSNSRAAARRVGIAFGSTGLPVQFPLPRHWPSPAHVARVTGRSPAPSNGSGCELCRRLYKIRRSEIRPG